MTAPLSAANFREAQRVGFQFAYENPRCGIFMDMGGGKTGMCLALVRKLFDEMECHKVLVVSTISNVTATWPLEAKEWQESEHFTTTTLRDPDNKLINAEVSKRWAKAKDRFVKQWTEKHGAGKVPALIDEWHTRWKAKLKAQWYRVKSYDDTHLHLINAEGFHHLCAEMSDDTWTYDAVIFDESTLFGSHSSIRFKKYQKLWNLPFRTILLSGSAFARGLESVWSQVFLLDGGKRLGKNVTTFRERYAYQHPHIRNKWIYRDEAEAEIREKIKDLCIWIPSDLDTVDDIRSTRYVTLSQKQAKQLKQMERDLFTVLDSGEEVEAANRAVLSSKLRQFANGFLYLEGEGYETIHNKKLEALVELVDEIDGNVIVAYEFKADEERILKAAKGSVVWDGSAEMKAQWNAGKIPVMLMNPQAAAHGLSLQHGGRDLIWYNAVWSLELTEQLEARIGRQRQAQSGYNRAARYHHIKDDQGIEDRVLKRLRELSDFQEATHDYLHYKRRAA